MKLSLDNIDIECPQGWEIVGFRKIREGEAFLDWSKSEERWRVLIAGAMFAATHQWAVKRAAWKPRNNDTVFTLCVKNGRLDVVLVYYDEFNTHHQDTFNAGFMFRDHDTADRARAAVVNILRSLQQQETTT